MDDEGAVTDLQLADAVRNLAVAGRALAILVVDDEAALREMLARALPIFGFSVQTAATGALALELYRKEKSDLVLLDVQMPTMDGLQTFREIRQIDPEATCIFMSGNLGEYESADLMNMGAAALVAKPFSLLELRELIVRCVSRR